MKIRELIAPNELDRRGTEADLPCVYDKKNRSVGAKKGLRLSTFSIKSTGSDGKVYARRTIWQK